MRRSSLAIALLLLVQIDASCVSNVGCFDVLTADGATCAAGMEIGSSADCTAAIFAANAAIGKPGYKSGCSWTVDTEYSEYYPKGCYSGCYTDSGYFCG